MFSPQTASHNEMPGEFQRGLFYREPGNPCCNRDPFTDNKNNASPDDLLGPGPGSVETPHQADRGSLDSVLPSDSTRGVMPSTGHHGSLLSHQQHHPQDQALVSDKQQWIFFVTLHVSLYCLHDTISAVPRLTTPAPPTHPSLSP